MTRLVSMKKKKSNNHTFIYFLHLHQFIEQCLYVIWEMYLHDCHWWSVRRAVGKVWLCIRSWVLESTLRLLGLLLRSLRRGEQHLSRPLSGRSRGTPCLWEVSQRHTPSDRWRWPTCTAQRHQWGHAPTPWTGFMWYFVSHQEHVWKSTQIVLFIKICLTKSDISCMHIKLTST